MPRRTVIARPDRKLSYVIIRREHSHLEPLIRETFGDAEDVKVFIDRRLSDRRKLQAEYPDKDPQRLNERRASEPILEILVSTNGLQAL